jgi:hypothetical protein
MTKLTNPFKVRHLQSHGTNLAHAQTKCTYVTFRCHVAFSGNNCNRKSMNDCNVTVLQFQELVELVELVIDFPSKEG